jgi:hypothetical protein
VPNGNVLWAAANSPAFAGSGSYHEANPSAASARSAPNTATAPASTRIDKEHNSLNNHMGAPLHTLSLSLYFRFARAYLSLALKVRYTSHTGSRQAAVQGRPELYLGLSTLPGPDSPFSRRDQGGRRPEKYPLYAEDALSHAEIRAEARAGASRSLEKFPVKRSRRAHLTAAPVSIDP